MSDLLLDTHALLWWWGNDPRLSSAALEAIADPDAAVHVSAASAWEIATKHRRGRLVVPQRVISRFHEEAIAESFRHLSISYAHARQAGLHEVAHKDPFDRMLAAQAEIESLMLVTLDRSFEEFPVTTLW
ncbi:type II toxin-antitoxin system VapC family toxin [Candidatus Poriferisodalis sp.]|uniref:type II toxin-antitoxin system VapC family toxin n=1 Tax=Candidatus Poriferisodalis sp. TaxID=3101277 RepID=UPI003B022513